MCFLEFEDRLDLAGASRSTHAAEVGAELVEGDAGAVEDGRRRGLSNSKSHGGSWWLIFLQNLRLGSPSRKALATIQVNVLII